ncbi:uncharacterized protein LOC115731848 [Rhodamnia argentea]|uniref:Uncharacterized protein LOC115731848 n=1 Tax=Rhodamnia argentea TaxID=178133 RepID=A0A8B8N8V4_9MYRT|nr:uncharacterized protein LOC115731848 [Rhodamnia argentea]
MSMPKEPELVMKLRGGSVLGKKTILKSDHFPGCQNKRLSPQIDGAPNYRQADSLHVHGVAIPTIHGIRNVLKHIGAQIDGKGVKVLWINLREEPVNASNETKAFKLMYCFVPTTYVFFELCQLRCIGPLCLLYELYLSGSFF